MEIKPVYRSGADSAVDELEAVHSSRQRWPSHWQWGSTLPGAPAGIDGELRQLSAGHFAAATPFTSTPSPPYILTVEVLRLHGYAQAQVSVAVSTLRAQQAAVQARVRIEPGQCFVFSSVAVSGDWTITGCVAAAPTRAEANSLVGTAWLRRNAISLRARLVGMLQNEGYYWARVDAELSEPETSRDAADAFSGQHGANRRYPLGGGRRAQSHEL